MIMPSELTQRGQNFSLRCEGGGKVSVAFRRPALEIRPWTKCSPQ